MKKIIWIGFLVTLLTTSGSLVLAEEPSSAPPTGSTQSQTSPPPPPPPPPVNTSGNSQPTTPFPPPSGTSGNFSQTMSPPQNMPSGSFQQNEANFQRDGANYQRDGANFQRDGANYMMSGNNSGNLPPKGQIPKEVQSQMMQGNDSSRSAQSQVQNDRENQKNNQMEKQQQLMAKRMGKQLSATLKSITKIQTKLQKAGLNLSSDCQSSISDAYTVATGLSGGSSDIDSSDVGEAMQSIGQCQMMGQQLLQVPTIYKTLSKSVIKFKKKNPDQNIDDEWNAVDKGFVTLKSGDFSQDDIFGFFDDARTLAEDIGINTAQFGPMPQGGPGQGNMMRGNNQGATVIKSITSFFGSFFK